MPATKTKKRKPTTVLVQNGDRSYKWGQQRFPASAQEVGQELEALEVRPGDYHRSSDILAVARANSGSAIHRCLNWNDTSAAEAHRLAQVRAILRSLCYVIVRGEHRAKQPVYVHVTDADGPRYVRSERIADEEDVRRACLDEALALLNGIRKRYQFLAELGSVFEAVEEVKRRKKRRAS